MKKTLAVKIVAAALALAGPCLPASRASTDEPDSDWTEFRAPAGPPTATPPDSPEGRFEFQDRWTFADQLHHGVLDQLCRSAGINSDYDFVPGDFKGTGISPKRYLAQLPDRSLAVVDEEGLHGAWGHGFLQSSQPGVPPELWIGGSIQAESMVVRRLPGQQSCAQIGRLANFRDVKSVLPITAERISQMEIGELWRIPMSLTVGHSVSAAGTPAPGLVVSVTFSDSQTGAAALTLFRLADGELRFRYRIDHATVHGLSAGVEEIPAADFPTVGGGVIGRLANNEIARVMTQYLDASMAWSRAKSDGKRLVLEYVVDPRDPAQAEAVAAAVKGDFLELARMGWHTATHQVTDRSTLEAYHRLQEEHDASLGAAAYGALDEYKQRLNSFPVKLPFLIADQLVRAYGRDKITRLTGAGGEFQIYRADRSRTDDFFDTPVLGPWVKTSYQRDAQAVAFSPREGDPQEPILVYLEQHGFLHHGYADVKRTAERFNDVMSLARPRGADDAGRARLPLNGLFSPAPPPPHVPPGWYSGRVTPEAPDEKGQVSFILAFNQKAVRDVLAAPAEEVTRAVQRAVPGGGESSGLAAAAQTAARLIADLAGARDAATPQLRAERLTDIVGGRGTSGLAYEGVVKVFIQLVDPLDLTGDFTARIDRPDKKFKSHLVLTKDRTESDLLKDAAEAKSRFAQPSILVD